MKLTNVRMVKSRRDEITRISKEFASSFPWPIEDSGFFIVDPLSAFLNTLGYENRLSQIPASDGQKQTLIMEFKGCQDVFIPGGSAIDHVDAANWMWL